MPTVLFHTNNEGKKAQIFALCRTLHFAARADDADAKERIVQMITRGLLNESVL